MYFDEKDFIFIVQTSLPHLHMALWLHKPSHDTKVGKEVSRISMGGHSWNDGVVRTFVWGKNIGMRGVQGEKCTTILCVCVCVCGGGGGGGGWVGATIV